MKRLLSIILGVFLLVMPFTGCKDKEKDDATLYKLTGSDGVYSLKIDDDSLEDDEQTVFSYELKQFAKMDLLPGLVSSSFKIITDRARIQNTLDYLFADIQLQESEEAITKAEPRSLYYTFYGEQGQVLLHIIVWMDGGVYVSAGDDRYYSKENACDYQALSSM